MDNYQIHNTLATDSRARHHFRGVYPRDSFLRLNIYEHYNHTSPCLFVCNLDEKDLPGSHWIVVEVNKSKRKVLYFDSYGMPPIYDDLLLKLASTGYEILWNNITLQDFDTTVCGQYCIIFCLLRARNIPFDSIIDLLLQNHYVTPHLRDHVVNTFIRHTFPVILSNLDKDIHNTSAFF